MNKSTEAVDFQELAKAMRENRDEESWTQDYVAGELGIDQKYYQRIEKYAVIPGTRLFLRIIKLLHISVDDYLYPTEQTNKTNRRRRIDSMLDKLNEKELLIIESTVKGVLRYKDSNMD